MLAGMEEMVTRNLKLDRALATNGWMEPDELEYIASLASRSKIIVELGTWRGRSAVCWAENTEGIVYCVDLWANDAYGIPFPDDPPDLHRRPEWLLTEFLRNTSGIRNIVPIRTRTEIAATIFSNLGIRPDVVFVDADHGYNGVVADINAWRPLLAEGGVLCGHDYSYYGWPDVKKVVDWMIPSFRVINTLWTTEA